MTLIIAGYEYSKSTNFLLYAEEGVVPPPPSMDLDGLFVVADSAITAHKGGRTLLNGFRKVHCIEAKLWKPYFMPDGSFKDYLEVYDTRQLFVAFAGSTLTAQHIINSITEHLSNLRISYRRENEIGTIRYDVIRHCQLNALFSDLSYWDDDTFLDSDFKELLTGEVIANTIEYSMNEALRSATRYKISIDEFNAMQTELVAGIWCPVRKRHELYLYRMLRKRGADGVLVAYTESSLVPENQVAVLGMRNQFESGAQNAFNNALSSFTSPAILMYEFLNNAIDQVQNSGLKDIDRPTSFRKLDRNQINRIK